MFQVRLIKIGHYVYLAFWIKEFRFIEFKTVNDSLLRFSVTLEGHHAQLLSSISEFALYEMNLIYCASGNMAVIH